MQCVWPSELRRDGTIQTNSLRSKYCFRDLSPSIGAKQNVLTVNASWRQASHRVRTYTLGSLGGNTLETPTAASRRRCFTCRRRVSYYALASPIGRIVEALGEWQVWCEQSIGPFPAQIHRYRHWNIGRRRIAERSISFARALPIDSEPELFRIVVKVPGEHEDIALKGVRTDQAMPLIAGINAHGD
jgi:hypothetical protein